MAERNLLREETGNFWLPSADSIELLPGRLQIFDNGSVEIIFDHILASHPFYKSTEILLGATGIQIYTFVDCTVVNGRHLSRGYENSPSLHLVLAATITISGWHYNSKKEIKLKNLFIYLTGFHEWVRTSGFKDLLWNPKKVVNIKYKLPGKIRLIRTARWSISIDFQYYMQGGLDTNERQRGIEQVECLHLTSYTGIRINELSRLLLKIQYFFTFVQGKMVYIKNIDLPPNFKEPEEVLNPISELFVQGRLQVSKDMDEASTYDFRRTSPLFYYTELPQNVGVVLDNWLMQDELMFSNMALYLSHINFAPIPIEQKLFTIIQCLEGHYRLTITGAEMRAMDKRKEELTTFVEILTPEQQKVLTKEGNPLEFAHEPQLFKKLSRLFKQCKSVVPMKGENRDRLARLLATYRNNYAHRLPDETYDWDNLLPCMQLAEIFFKCCVLKHLGLQDSEIYLYHLLPEHMDRRNWKWLEADLYSLQSPRIGKAPTPNLPIQDSDE